MSFYKKLFLKKIFSSVLLFSLILPFTFFSFPQKTNAQWVVTDPGNTFTNIARTVKEYVGDQLANIIAKTIIRKLTAQTVNWINSGFEGSPAFITDPGQFFSGVGNTVASDFLSNTALKNLCSPFNVQVRVSLAKNYLQEDPYGYTCTLGQVANNYDNFVNDFNQGGWSSWFAITQNSQNNPYGAYLGARNELAVKIGTQQDKYQKQLDWGNGFLSYERCKPGTEKIPTITTGLPGQNLNIDKDTPTCFPQDKETVTPGKVIDDQLSNALGNSWKQLEAADEINEIVSALVVQLTNKIIGGAVSGLKGLSQGSPATNNRAYIESLANESPETLAEDAERINKAKEDAQELKNDFEEASNSFDPPTPTSPTQTP